MSGSQRHRARSSGRPVGRRPGDPATTRRTILDAARDLFAEVGFDRATIRAIAARADVDPASVIHHFGGKQQLFVAAHELPFDPSTLLADVANLPADERGAAIARTYLTVIGAPGSPALSMLRAAATNEAAAAMMREFVTATFISWADRIAPGPDAATRLALAGAQMLGVAFGRGVLELPALTEASVDELVALLGPAVQRCLDGSAP